VQFPEVVGMANAVEQAWVCLPWPSHRCSRRRRDTTGSATARMSHMGGGSASQLPPHTSLLGGIPATCSDLSSVTSPFKYPRPPPLVWEWGCSQGQNPTGG
jgi:hypothetical protein